jgi:hypothetical protein
VERDDGEDARNRAAGCVSVRKYHLLRKSLNCNNIHTHDAPFLSIHFAYLRECLAEVAELHQCNKVIPNDTRAD